jgi:thiol-disulfide isomerase/thioredoxin
MSYSSYFSKIFENKFYILLILFIIILFAGISMYYYNKFVLTKLNKKFVDNKEFLNKNNQDEQAREATLYYFYTTWCPHSKIANVEINKLKNAINGNVNGVNIIIREIDSDQDSETTDKFEVTGYPTIKLIYNDKIYDYDAKPQLDTLLQFLDSVLQ